MEQTLELSVSYHTADEDWCQGLENRLTDSFPDSVIYVAEDPWNNDRIASTTDLMSEIQHARETADTRVFFVHKSFVDSRNTKHAALPIIQGRNNKDLVVFSTQPLKTAQKTGTGATHSQKMIIVPPALMSSRHKEETLKQIVEYVAEQTSTRKLVAPPRINWLTFLIVYLLCLFAIGTLFSWLLPETTNYFLQVLAGR